jgi:hypothetical protein
MASDKQIEANQQNALKGGVKTPEGKAITRYNAEKHGIFRIALSEYEVIDHEGIIKALVREFHPVGISENMLVQRIALCYLRLYRVARAESEFMNSQLHTNLSETSENSLLIDLSIRREVKKVDSGYQPQITSQTISELEKVMLRYDVSIENRLYKALHELQWLQTLRRSKNTSFSSIVNRTT